MNMTSLTAIVVTVAIICIAYPNLYQGASVSNGCPTPSLTLNGSSVVARRNSTPDYSTLSEIKFTARMPSPFTAKSHYRSCKIKCVAGQWVGPLCKVVEENNVDDGRFHPVLRSCKLNLNGTNLVLAQDTGTLLKQWIGRIPDRSIITIRCDGAPGLYKLQGESNLKCSDGDWSHELPRCLPTTSISAYSENSPPTIRVRLAFGNSAIDYRNNHVVIYPGSIVHLECLFQRRYGDVRWTWVTVQPQQQQESNHLTGWSIAVDERERIYRMSLYYVKSEVDSGNYTCITPMHQNNTVTLKIDTVQCEKRNEEEKKRQTISSAKTQGYYIGQKIDYSCSYGFTLVGSNQSQCLADGRWSSNVPYCKPIVCPSLLPSLFSMDAPLTATGTNNTYGSKISFRCASGYALKGANEVNCKIDGRWSSPVPKCIDILCAPPAIPAHGYLIERSFAASAGPTYRVGTVVQFACEQPYRVIGPESVVCKENGIWSDAPPNCRLVCEYPTQPANGRLLPPKLWYEIGSNLQVICDDGYFINDSKFESKLEFIFVTCAQNGTWSTDVPRCIN